MALVAADLAEAIRVEMGFPTPVSDQLLGWSEGVVQHLQSAATIDNASGSVVGTCPSSGGPLQDGAATGGVISGMSGSTMAPIVQSEAGYPHVSSELSTFCDEIVNHIQSNGVVDFAVGNITGNCTNTSTSPGSLQDGAGTGGEISGLDGSVLANSIHSAVGYPGGVSDALVKFCTAIVNYIMANGEASYPTGQVTGTCPAGGGALQSGTGSGGVIS